MFNHWFKHLGDSLEMYEPSHNPFGCGTYLTGHEGSEQEYAWFYQYSDLFVVARCNFVLQKDIPIQIDEDVQYLGMRLNYRDFPSPGQILAFLEEDSIHIDLTLKKGTRFNYCEVLYAPELYSRQFNKAFSGIASSPDEVLKSMGSSHNWSSQVSKVLYEIYENNSKGPAAELFYVGKACELLGALIEMGTERVPRKARDYEDIQKVIHYINDHYKENIKHSDLVRLSNMSATKLKVLFKSFTDYTITDYIIKKKLDVAQHLLSETDLSIDDIAKDCGFETISGFSTSFRKNTGMSPSAYRKQTSVAIHNNDSYFH